MTNLKPAADYDQMVQALERYEAATYYAAEDLRTMAYERNTEFGTLHFPNRAPLELNEWSSRQLCRAFGIPFGIFRRASEDLAKEMVQEFGKGVKKPEVKLAVRKLGTAKETLRGILPLDYPDVRNSHVIRTIENTGQAFMVQSAGWMDEANPPTLRTRFIFPQMTQTVNNELFYIGVDYLSSELGGSPLVINLLLFREVCTNGAIASYGNKPYFYFNYGHQMVVDLQDVMQAASNRLGGEVQMFSEKVEQAIASVIDLPTAATLLDNLMTKKLIDKGVAIKACRVLEKDGCNNLWDVVNAVTSAARGFRDVLRLRYEQAGGVLLGLQFNRSTTEEPYAEKAKEIHSDKLLLEAPQSN